MANGRAKATDALTPKGRRRAAAILDATLRSLARDGYAATSIQRVADEARVHKRVVLYYYGSREQLFDAVVRHLGDRLFDAVEADLAGVTDPAEIVERGFSVIWDAVTTDRALLVAWFGLRAEAVTSPTLGATAAYITDRFRRLVRGLIDETLARDRTSRIDRDALEVLVVAGAQGLILDYLERGETVALGEAIIEFQRWMSSVTVPRIEALSST